ncbi:MAG: tail fiber domain-containing protein [Bacteroidota bacterium]
MGNEAGYDNTEGHHNTAVGDSAGTDCGVGLYNTFIGAAAGAATEHADYNTFIGSYAGWDNNRTNSTTNANRNTYVGFLCGFSNRIGEDNVGMGAYADFNNTARSRCTFIGANIDVRDNDGVAIGYSAGIGQEFAVAIGNYADVNQEYGVALGGITYVNGDYGVAIGYLDTVTGARGVAVGYDASSTAADAVAAGYLANASNTNAIAIGANSAASGENSVAIGYASSVTANNYVYIGNSTTASIGGVVNWTATSDARFKNDVREDIGGLDFILKLRPVSYNMDVNAIEQFHGRTLPPELQVAAQDKSKVRYSGFLAQEVEEAAQVTGYDFSGIDTPDSEDDAYGIRYAEFVVPLVKAVQELNAKIESQRAVISEQTDLIGSYESAMEEMRLRLNAMEAEVRQQSSTKQVVNK